MEKNRQGKNSLNMVLKPIGIVRNEINEPVLVAESGDLIQRQKNGLHKYKERVSELIIDKGFANCLDGVEGFSHLVVLYWAHLVHSGGRSLTRVHPMGRKDLPLSGIFATCSPARPNPICTIVVRLLERKENVLIVKGLDAVDSSPIIDIKPYNPGYYTVKNVKIPDWMERVQRERSQKKS